MLYLACPYSDPDPAVRQRRYETACRATTALLRAGVTVYCPIVYGHSLTAHGLPDGWGFWSRFDRMLLEIADGIVVLTLDGWERSEGVQEEVALAEAMGLPVFYLGPGSFGGPG